MGDYTQEGVGTVPGAGAYSGMDLGFITEENGHNFSQLNWAIFF